MEVRVGPPETAQLADVDTVEEERQRGVEMERGDKQMSAVEVLGV